MEREIIQFEPRRPYARGSRVGDLIFLAGHVGYAPGTTSPVAGGIEAQTTQLFENVRESLALFGAGMDDIVRNTVYLVDSSHGNAFWEIRSRYVREPVASSTIIVKELLDGCLVEVDVVAALAGERLG